MNDKINGIAIIAIIDVVLLILLSSTTTSIDSLIISILLLLSINIGFLILLHSKTTQYNIEEFSRPIISIDNKLNALSKILLTVERLSDEIRILTILITSNNRNNTEQQKLTEHVVEVIDTPIKNIEQKEKKYISESDDYTKLNELQQILRGK